MNANSANATSSRFTLEKAVREIYRKVCAEIRRGVELTVQAYGHGIQPPF